MTGYVPYSQLLEREFTLSKAPLMDAPSDEVTSRNLPR
jgi:hypothetical protein